MKNLMGYIKKTGKARIHSNLEYAIVKRKDFFIDKTGNEGQRFFNNTQDKLYKVVETGNE